MGQIQIPYNFSLRDYQEELYCALDGGLKRALIVWHRRAGKDLACWNYMIKAAFERVGQYYYCFPLYGQGRKIIWEGITNDGRKYLDYIPPELVKRMVNQDMLIELTTGSIIRIIGVDNIDTVVGTNPVGIIMSEYSLQDPQGWQFLSPIVAANNGWVIFNGTPRGRNHQYKLDQRVRKLDHWFYSMKTVDDTKDDNGLPLVPSALIDLERAEGKDEDIIQQEYFCSYTAAMKGSYYSDLIEKARASGRIREIPVDENLWIDLYMDIGIDDSTAIWFNQPNQNRDEFVDYLENSGQGMPWYVKELVYRGYQYRDIYLPHDGAHKTWQTGKTNKAMLEAALEQAGLKHVNVIVCQKLPVLDGINATRKKFAKAYFNECDAITGNNGALEKLGLYHKKWDARRMVFLKQPVHDWTSHCADAFRTWGIADDPEHDERWERNYNVVEAADFNPLGD